jgi:hypothetical protein
MHQVTLPHLRLESTIKQNQTQTNSDAKILPLAARPRMILLLQYKEKPGYQKNFLGRMISETSLHFTAGGFQTSWPVLSGSPSGSVLLEAPRLVVHPLAVTGSLVCRNYDLHSPNIDVASKMKNKQHYNRGFNMF